MKLRKRKEDRPGIMKKCEEKPLARLFLLPALNVTDIQPINGWRHL
jgi:hypothetical protein